MSKAPAQFNSFNWMRGVADDHTLSDVQRLVLVRLCLHRHNDDGRCDPGYDVLAKELGFHRVTVIRAVAAGAARGWVTEPTSRGRTCNNFEFKFPNNTTPERLHGSDGYQAQPSHGSDGCEPSTVALGHTNGSAEVTQPSLRQQGSLVPSNTSSNNGRRTGEKNGRERARARASSHPNFQTKRKKESSGAASSRPEPIPVDWQPSADDLTYATDKALTPGEIERAVERFRAYKVGKRVSSSGAWRDWVQRDVEHKRERSGHNTPVINNSRTSTTTIQSLLGSTPRIEKSRSRYWQACRRRQTGATTNEPRTKLEGAAPVVSTGS
jgi:hypothetical protein